MMTRDEVVEWFKNAEGWKASEDTVDEFQYKTLRVTLNKTCAVLWVDKVFPFEDISVRDDSGRLHLDEDFSVGAVITEQD